MTLKQELGNITNQLGSWLKTGLNEAQTTQAIILRLLQALEYDIWNPTEVFPQETGNAGIPDFIVSRGDKRHFVVEVKKLDATLDEKMKTQAVSYANNHAMRWAILTNGSEWLFFDSFMQNKQAHNRLVLTLSLKELDLQLLVQYFERLLHASIWTNPSNNVEETAKDIQAHIELNSRLQPLAKRLEQLMEEYTVQDFEAGLKLAKRLKVWDEDSVELLDNNLETFRQLTLNVEVGQRVDSTNTTNELPTKGTSLEDALRLGIQKTSPQTRKEGKSSGLEASVGDEKVQAASWRDIHAGIAEALLILGHGELLKQNVYIYQDSEERRMTNGKPYDPSAYRKLSDGRFLFLHYSAKDHIGRIKKLLRAVDAPSGIISANYKESEFDLP